MILTTQCYHLMGVCVQTKDKLECVDQYLTAIDQSFGVKYQIISQTLSVSGIEEIMNAIRVIVSLLNEANCIINTISDYSQSLALSIATTLLVYVSWHAVTSQNRNTNSEPVLSGTCHMLI